MKTMTFEFPTAEKAADFADEAAECNVRRSYRVVEVELFEAHDASGMRYQAESFGGREVAS